MHLTVYRRAALGLALGAGCALALQGLALPAAHADTPAAARQGSQVGAAEDTVARSLAASLGSADWRAQVRGAALGSAPVGLASLAAGRGAPAALAGAVTAAEQRIAAAKGLGADAGPLLRLRLGADSMRAALTPDAVPLVAVASDDDGGAAVTAYDSAGRAHALSATRIPREAVYVVDLDVDRATAAGLAQVDKALGKAGLRSAAASPAAASPAATGGYWTTKVDSVHLNDDEEPWILGDAEIYSIVTGFGLDGKVRVDTVDMPYLDNDGTTYYPNQILVSWNTYKYNLADVVMMEADSDTNYAALAKALADALLTITDQGAYIPLVDAILDALPASWYTNDDDYVDSWYTLGTNSSGLLNGARGNGRMTVEPYWVAQL
ncbi:DUF3103 family protein [Streptomyces sp. NRRL F-5123]|uniref:DUF3103 family protein n=1 Tax=Streptomyces sp. NRRL F-5123 TaxID=1463856 RepID=UPI0004E0E19E|nr:DUF3103 family protein [Streptomyces sp. NRRL F-5123]